MSQRGKPEDGLKQDNFSWAIYDAPVLMITFHSPSNAQGIKGFAVEYEVLTNGSHVSSLSAHQIVGPDVGHIKFPADREKYSYNELATFVFPPLDNASIGLSARMLLYKLLRFDSSDCGNTLTIYYFDPVTKLYKLGGSLCDDVSTELITLTDLSVFVFRSDSYIVKETAGFTLDMSNCVTP